MEDKEVKKAHLIKLEDMLNSQQSLIEKTSVIQVDLFNHPDSDFEKKLNNIAHLANQAYDMIKTVKEEYQEKHSISLTDVVEEE